MTVQPSVSYPAHWTIVNQTRDHATLRSANTTLTATRLAGGWLIERGTTTCG